jgi:hypothetical protein
MANRLQHWCPRCWGRAPGQGANRARRRGCPEAAVAARAGCGAMMRLPGNDRRALDRIERALLSDDLHLSLMFAFFTRLAGNDAIPGTEQVGNWPRWLRLPVLISAAGLMVIVAALIVSVTAGRAAMLHSRRRCLGIQQFVDPERDHRLLLSRWSSSRQCSRQ